MILALLKYSARANPSSTASGSPSPHGGRFPRQQSFVKHSGCVSLSFPRPALIGTNAGTTRGSMRAVGENCRLWRLMRGEASYLTLVLPKTRSPLTPHPFVLTGCAKLRLRQSANIRSLRRIDRNRNGGRHGSYTLMSCAECRSTNIRLPAGICRASSSSRKVSPTLREPCKRSATFPPRGKVSKTTIFLKYLGTHALELEGTCEPWVSCN